MRKAKAKSVVVNPDAMPVYRAPEQTTEQALSRTALRPSINGASVMKAYQGNIMGKDADLSELVKGLSDSCKRVNGGDLSTLEAMLVSQATALQTIFTSLARRAQDQEYQKNLEAFLGLALKAQAQSRATISALVDLKYPRQATFVKQANIAHGPQQVNNGAGADGSARVHAQAHGEKSAPEQSKLLEAEHGQPGGRMDTRAAQAAERSYQAVETVAKIHRAKKPRG
ncbi:hypothetical protein [Polaromonas eurypsychrophila]|uniref:Uncharacterized protein n=1 Tax=Polaromonas eurypsychrophila TaxID=1614635 RepID=A0A916SJL0_9BURK|nr:hypothetical protein [Polaromonas eurypsychrophila]GGB00839.1 hypothetical protein GCM10011496_22240 [Polaromonas eurypsychrophila]